MLYLSNAELQKQKAGEKKALKKLLQQCTKHVVCMQWLVIIASLGVLSEYTEQGLLWMVAEVQCASVIQAVHTPLVVDSPMPEVDAAIN